MPINVVTVHEDVLKIELRMFRELPVLGLGMESSCFVLIESQYRKKV